ncbi:hypothetical protein [Bacillus sp. 7884-1]|uniref:hypothetical protein n=1 Tax=Bacillus sp. 7884-1 TaxID=2021693 RepID=UPI000BA69EEB|nr:hypothetical protein [Bacillus sp. 7884-1]PAE35437.1 hypothetical protein CHI06_23605 [Bacillus sp. 7884-1]
MTIWVDIDKPTKHFGIHNENKSRNPKFKGTNKMGRDGAWFELTSKNEAFELHKREYPTFTLVDRTE